MDQGIRTVLSLPLRAGAETIRPSRVALGNVSCGSCSLVQHATYPVSEGLGYRMANWSILVGSIVVAFVCWTLLVSSILFAAGVSLSWFQLPIALAMAAGFGWWATNRYFLHERVCAFLFALGTSLVAFLFVVLLNSALFDVSWDGQTYHAEAIARLATGWNPLRDGPPKGVDYPTELAFFAKGPWICAAALYQFTGSFEGGKAFHLALILACWLLWLAALSSFRGISRRWALIISLLVAFNPVSSYQMFTNYVDGQLASLLGIAVGLLILIDRSGDRVLMALLALVVILTINVKLTGALYMAIVGAGYWLWYAIVRKTRRLELGAWLLAGAILGGGLVGYNPYVTQFLNQFITTGNPFSPYADWRSVIILVSGWLFPGMGRFERLFASLFSPSAISPSPSFQLKPPFTFSLNEIRQFHYPDVLVGGFGPLFSGALLWSTGLLALLIWEHRRQLLHHASLLVLIGLIVISALSFSEVWWARFAPQVWMIPVMIGTLGLLTVRLGRRRWLAPALMLILCFNNLMIYFSYVTYSFEESSAAARQLTMLKRQREPLLVSFNRFPGMRYRFQREGIRFIEVETLPCAQDRRQKVRPSQAEICRRE